MKKYFTLLIFPFLFLNNVFADTTVNINSISIEDCSTVCPFKLYSATDNNFGEDSPFIIRSYWSYDSTNNTLSLVSNNYSIYYSKFIILEPNTNYTSYANSNYWHYIYLFDTSYNYINFFSNSDGSVSNTYTFTTPNDNTLYYALVSYRRTQVFNGNNIRASIYKTVDNPENPYLWSSTTCPTVPTPPTPPSDTSSFSDFLPLYLDRITYLGNAFINNSYLFSFVSIIFAWCVLELFIRLLHLRKGSSKL